MKKRLKIKTVTYSRINNLGDYENERLELTAEVPPGETVESVTKKLKMKVEKILDLV